MILGFAEVPFNETINLGSMEQVVFRCRHASSEATITWLVNGPSVVQLPDIRLVFVNENGNIVYTLTIPAEPTVQWNRGCVPGFLPGWISMQMKGHL